MMDPLSSSPRAADTSESKSHPPTQPELRLVTEPVWAPSARDLMLATSAARPFDRAGWLFELKYDGFRVLAIRRGDQLRLLSRRGNDLLPCFPEVAACLRELPDIVLDGELVVLDEKGKPIFERVRRRARTRKPTSVTAAAERDPAAMFAFDVLSSGGKDVRKLPLVKRKQIVQDALRGSPRIRPVRYVGEQGVRLYETACALQLEGIVAKLADAPYNAGRSREWLKIRTPHGRDVQAERSA